MPRSSIERYTLGELTALIYPAEIRVRARELMALVEETRQPTETERPISTNVEGFGLVRETFRPLS